MNITLPSGDRIRGDLIVSAVLRTDLVPVPVTLECKLRYDADLAKQLTDGAIVRAGLGDSELRIIQVTVDPNGGGVQQGELNRPVGLISFIAILDACAEIAFRRSRAVIKESATLGGIYRACGAKVVIESDFTVDRFTCLAGGVPSYHIAVALQEESGALVWRPDVKRLKFMRLVDLMAQQPAESLPDGGEEAVRSRFLERHEVPWFYSIAPDGSFVYGSRELARAVHFSPGKTELKLRNMTRALIHDRVVRGRLNVRINAGDILKVSGKALVVTTAAHAFQSGTDGGAMEQVSHFWLSSLEG